MAITDEQYRETDRRITQYFADRKILHRVENEIEATERRIESLRARLSKGITIKPPSATSSYSDMPMSPSYESGLERRLEKAENDIERYERQLKEQETFLLDLRVKLEEIRQRMTSVASALSLLSRSDRDLVQRKYGRKQTNVELAQAMTCDEATIRRRFHTIIGQLAQVLEIADTDYGRKWMRRVKGERDRRNQADKSPKVCSQTTMNL